jgi:hypothetical protein
MSGFQARGIPGISYLGEPRTMQVTVIGNTGMVQKKHFDCGMFSATPSAVVKVFSFFGWHKPFSGGSGVCLQDERLR